MKAQGSEEIREVARALVAEAFRVLRIQHVLPRPVWDAHIRVGGDYWGPDLMGRPAFKRFESALSTDYPNRFENRIRPYDEYQDFPNSFAFSLIEICS